MNSFVILRCGIRLSALILAGLGAIGCRNDNDSIQDTSLSVYIPPLAYSYDHWEHHLLQWLPDHPRYEMVEALIGDQDQPVIHFFFTERAATDGSKKQIHYTNNKAFADRLAQGAGDSEVEFVSIDYTPPAAGSVPTFRFALEAPEGPVAWQFCASGEPDPTYAAGLVNNVTENAHNPKGGLLFFYLPESTTSDGCTLLSVGGTQYAAAPWPEISVPPYFVAYRAVYSRNIDLGYFYSSEPMQIRVNAEPSELRRGAAWSISEIGESGKQTRETSLEVADLQGQDVTLANGSTTYATTLENGELATTDITVTDRAHSMRVHFASAVPDLRYLDEKKRQIALTISTGSVAELASGVLAISRVDGKLKLEFLPNRPDFLQASSLMTAIDLADDGYTLEAHTLYPNKQ